MRLSGKPVSPEILYGCALFFLLLALLLSICIGVSEISPSELLPILLSPFGDSSNHSIIYQLRLPRGLLAIGIGSVLAMSGAMTQGLFRNPLADPSLIGVSAGAAAGASLTMMFGSLVFVSIGAFVGGMLVVALVYRIASYSTGLSVITMLLAGLAMNFLAGSITSVLELLGSDDFLRRMSLWRMGGIDNASYQDVGLMFVILCVFICLVPKLASALNAFLLGESEARHLGFSVNRIKASVFVLVALGVGLSVALAGMIAFIGLIVPHMVRLLVGPNHWHVLPLSALTGAAFLLIADTLARTIFAPIEIPVGLMTAILGAPLFIILLRQRLIGAVQ